MTSPRIEDCQHKIVFDSTNENDLDVFASIVATGGFNNFIVEDQKQVLT